MTDYAVLRAYKALIDEYSAERARRELRGWQPTGPEQQLFDAAKQMCEWRLGRTFLPEAGPDTSENVPDPIEVETLVICLK